MYVRARVQALEPFICETSAVEQTDPVPLPYLRDPKYGSYDIALEVDITGKGMAAPATVSKSNFKYLYWSIRQQLVHHTVTGCNMRPGDLLGSGTISGPVRCCCCARAGTGGGMIMMNGDAVAAAAAAGALCQCAANARRAATPAALCPSSPAPRPPAHLQTPGSYGSMLELAWKGTRPLDMPDGTKRVFLQDGDTVNVRGFCVKDGVRVGFGDCAGTILPATPYVDPAAGAAGSASAAAAAGSATGGAGTAAPATA